MEAVMLRISSSLVTFAICSTLLGASGAGAVEAPTFEAFPAKDALQLAAPDLHKGSNFGNTVLASVIVHVQMALHSPASTRLWNGGVELTANSAL